MHIPCYSTGCLILAVQFIWRDETTGAGVEVWYLSWDWLFHTRSAIKAQRSCRTVQLNVPVLLFLRAPCIDFCNNRPSRPFHAPAAVHRSNTNNYTIITSPAAPTEWRRPPAPASGSAAQLALNLWHRVFSALPWWVKAKQRLLQDLDKHIYFRKKMGHQLIH